MGYLHLCSTLSPYMDYCQGSLVVQKAACGWPLRIATVARQVFLCVENGAMNLQPPGGLRPESTRPSTAASREISFRLLNRHVPRSFVGSRRRRGPQLAERPPDSISTLAYPLVFNQLTRHRCEHVVISVDRLKTFGSELPFHGQGHE